MNKKEIKIMFVDFDWTIFDHTVHDFDYASIEALKTAQKAGIEVILSTARSYHSLKALKFFKLFTPDGMITANGTALFYKDKLIKSEPIADEVIKAVSKEAMKHHCNLELTGPRSRYVVSKRRNYLEKIYAVFYDEKPKTKAYDGKPIVSMLFMGPEKYDEDIKKLLPEGMYFNRFFDLGADISFTEGNKGLAVDFFLNYLGLKKNNAMSFGDSWLDVSMFESTKYSVCMGNAKDEIKEKALMVTSSVSDSGVAKVVNEVLKNR